MRHTDLNPAPKAGNFDGSNLPTGNGVSEVNTAKVRTNDGGNAVARGIYPYRKFLGATVALGFAVLMAWHVTLNTPNAGLSDLNLANIDALAQSNESGESGSSGESGGSSNGNGTCGTDSQHFSSKELCGRDRYSYLSGVRYKRVTGTSSYYQEGCRANGTDCYGRSINTDTVQTYLCK